MLGAASLLLVAFIVLTAWWVLRGYLVAMVIADGLDSGGPIGLLPRVGGSDFIALLLLAACILPSIWFGRRGLPLSRGPRLAYYAGSAALVLVAAVVLTRQYAGHGSDVPCPRWWCLMSASTGPHAWPSWAWSPPGL